jgi:hypothetical protein
MGRIEAVTRRQTVVVEALSSDEAPQTVDVLTPPASVH